MLCIALEKLLFSNKQVIFCFCFYPLYSHRKCLIKALLIKCIHKIGFLRRSEKKLNTFWLKKGNLSRAMNFGQVFHEKILSFKIAMSGRAGIWCRPRFTFWLTFFQSDMLPLFFSGKNCPYVRHFFLFYLKIKMLSGVMFLF